MPAKSRPKTHKHKPGKFSMAEVHKLSKFVKKVAPSMKFRRGRTGKGMYGRGGGEAEEDEKMEYMRQGKAAKFLIDQGHPVKEVMAKFPMLR